MKFAYYPGCTLRTTAVEYDRSLRAVASALGLDLQEVDDWNCCGASPAAAFDPALGLALAARNLALAEVQGAKVLLAPCSGCYQKAAKAQRTLSRAEAALDGVSARAVAALKAAGQTYRGTVSVRHPVDLFVTDLGLPAVRARLARSLAGLRVVCYYGCLLTRPKELTGYHSIRPTSLDRLTEALGAMPLPFRQRTSCCGGPVLLSHPEVAFRKTKALLDEALEQRADCLVSPCPLCSMNLDGRQADIERAFGVRYDMPVLYFSQLMGLAFDLPPRVLGLHKNIVSPRRVLEKIR
ncbi:MAG: CoB--CoM heterodisulfide reductase iron-sulfur subunit B family protein [Candidatus Methylomirabilia bacterium]